MPSGKNFTLDSGCSALSGLSDDGARPRHSTKGGLKMFQMPDPPAQLVPNSIHSTLSTTPVDSEIVRMTSDGTKSRRTKRCYQGQKRPSEYLVEPTKGRKSPKRRIQSEGRDSADEDTHGSQPTQMLACPFWKLDGNRHFGCLKFELRRPKDVKQHISRKHLSPEFYCARCWQTFPDRGRQDEHARMAFCAIQPKPLFEGISDEQKDQLKRSGGRGATPEQQWYDIWDTLFPEKQRPSSVYLGNFMKETLGYIQNRCRNEDWENMLSIVRKTRGEPVEAGLVKDIVTVALAWFRTFIDSTPGGCESGLVDTDTLSQSDTSSSSGSVLDLDSLHGDTLAFWPFGEYPLTYDFESDLLGYYVWDTPPQV